VSDQTPRDNIDVIGNADEQRKAGLKKTEIQILSELFTQQRELVSQSLVQQRELLAQSMMQKTLLVAILALMAALILGLVLAFFYLLYQGRHHLERRYISRNTPLSVDFVIAMRLHSHAVT